MSWWMWVLIGLVVLGLLGAIGDAGKPVKAKKSARSKASASPDERTAKLIDESIQIAKQTKRRDTAESRIELAEKLLSELVAQKSVWVDEKITRSRIEHVRTSFKERFPPKRSKPDLLSKPD